jgi:hypothetical protein
MEELSCASLADATQMAIKDLLWHCHADIFGISNRSLEQLHADFP